MLTGDSTGQGIRQPRSSKVVPALYHDMNNEQPKDRKHGPPNHLFRFGLW